MPKRFSKNFIALLAAYKGDDKPKKAEVKETPSSYKGVQSSSFSTNYGSGTSGLVADPNDKKAKIYQTTASLSPELAKISGTAEKGFGENLSYLQRDPEERVSWFTGGNDPLYSIQMEQANRNRQEAIGRQQVDAQQGGITNSTTFGSALGRIANDDILRRNQILLSSLDWGNQNARTDAQLNLGAITGLNSLITPYGSAAGSMLQTAKGSQDTAGAATANAYNEAEMAHVEAMNQYNAAKKKSMGNMIGGGIGTLASIGLAPFTGGASLAALPGTLSMMGGGGGGSAPVPSRGYSWTNPFANSAPVDYASMGNRINIDGSLGSTAGLVPL